jgi:hypothetical protein
MIGEDQILGKNLVPYCVRATQRRAHERVSQYVRCAARCRAHSGEFIRAPTEAAGRSASRNPATSMSTARDGAPMTPINLGPCYKDLQAWWYTPWRYTLGI